ncbi:MAG: hypothetical protein ACTSQJ_19640, partial [Promethearchaeota archaeon]
SLSLQCNPLSKLPESLLKLKYLEKLEISVELLDTNSKNILEKLRKKGVKVKIYPMNYYDDN